MTRRMFPGEKSSGLIEATSDGCGMRKSPFLVSGGEILRPH